MSISPGDRLGYVGDRLRFLEKSSPRWRIVGKRGLLLRKSKRIVEGHRVIAKEVDDKRTKEER